MFVDKVSIMVKAGNGGDGAVSFRHEKYVSNGGPNGGDGGKGGDIILRVKDNINTLVDFRFTKHYRAENGQNGDTKNMSGKQGQNLYIDVPCGTLVRDAETGKVIVDMYDRDKVFTLLRGGNGGKGNQHYASSRRQTPRYSQDGQKTKEHTIILELKTIADVGFVGFPNVGKSTLLGAMTDAKPKIANYHFTTLSPNLGVLKQYEKTCVLADIPGLIEGASTGAGLGYQFLRHIERTRLIVHIVDISGCESREPWADFVAINKELYDFSEKLAELPQIIVLNKIDLLQEGSTAVADFKKALKSDKKHKNCEVFEISANQRSGINDLVTAIFNKLDTMPAPEPIAPDDFEFDVRDYEELKVEKLDEGVYQVSGTKIEELARKIDEDDEQSIGYFQKRLRDDGINAKLRKLGIQNGDTVILGDKEFEYSE